MLMGKYLLKNTMASPKNYKKVEPEPYEKSIEHKWIHTSKDITVFVTAVAGKGYRVEVYSGLNDIYAGNIRSNKEHARKFAVKWMRENSNPLIEEI